jgi:phospholipase/lecithinase/hemolysin
MGGCSSGRPCPPYDQGHYSNGPTAVEYLADAIVSGGATQSNFFNFAVSGATTGAGNSADGGSQSSSGTVGLPGMQQQIELYYSAFAGTASNNALHVVWGGPNDFLTLGSPQLAAQNIAGYVDALAGSGAGYILVPNMPDLSMTPLVRFYGANAINAALGFSLDFNQALSEQLDDLASLYPAAHIARFDTFGFMNGILANPSAYGFTNAADPCITMTTICMTPNDYVFWDDFHPTTRLHAVIASAMLNQVPVPSAALLYISAVCVFGLFRLFARP